MSRLSIFETRWIDLVFENRNKEYGAYQLRRESVKSSFTALFMGLLFVASIGAIPTISSYFNTEVIPDIQTPEWEETIIQVTDLDRPKPKNEALPQTETEVQAAQPLITQPVLRDPVIVSPNQASPEVPINTQITNTISNPTEGTGTIGNPVAASGPGTGIIGVTDTGAGKETTSIVNASILDKMPEFPGGMDQFYKYVGNNFEKPEIDAMGNIKIYVSFVIEKDGSMTDIKVQKDPGYGLGREAVRVLKSLKTKWSPGILNAKAVRTAYNLPIVIKINE
ncbi:MAG: energy transducer TonB [Bacteroidota bacterium]